jgi:DNA end-binding protein Ku
MQTATISFGLVNVPVKLYKAVESPTSMHKHHAIDGGRIRQKQWCEVCKKEVTKDEVVKGTEVNGQVVTVTEDELKMLRPEKSSAIKIVEFVPRFEIDSLYFGAHYYLGVDKKQPTEPFFLLRNALRECGKIAIGTYTKREKEYACAIEPYKSGLLLTDLNYLEEIRDIEEIAVKEPEVNDEDLKLAQMLIKQRSVDELDLSKFKDSFKADLQALIATKAAGETFSVESEHLEAPKSTLKEALEASLTTINWQAEKSEA